MAHFKLNRLALPDPFTWRRGEAPKRLGLRHKLEIIYGKSKYGKPDVLRNRTFQEVKIDTPVDEQ